MKKLVFLTFLIAACGAAYWLISPNTDQNAPGYRLEFSYAWDPATDKYWALGARVPDTANQENSPTGTQSLYEAAIVQVSSFCCLNEHLIMHQRMTQRRQSDPDALREKMLQDHTSDEPDISQFSLFEGYTDRSAALVRLGDIDPEGFLSSEVREVIGPQYDRAKGLYVAHLAIVEQKLTSGLKITLSTLG